jgi:hypothetical protein
LTISPVEVLYSQMFQKLGRQCTELPSDQRRLQFSQKIHHPNPIYRQIFAPSTPVRFTPVAPSSSSTKLTSMAAHSHGSTFVTPPQILRIAIPKSSQCQAPSGSINSTKGSLPYVILPSHPRLSVVIQTRCARLHCLRASHDLFNRKIDH